MYPTLSNKEQDYIINKIKSFIMSNYCIIPAREVVNVYLEKT